MLAESNEHTYNCQFMGRVPSGSDVVEVAVFKVSEGFGDRICSYITLRTVTGAQVLSVQLATEEAKNLARILAEAANS